MEEGGSCKSEIAIGAFSFPYGLSQFLQYYWGKGEAHEFKTDSDWVKAV